MSTVRTAALALALSIALVPSAFAQFFGQRPLRAAALQSGVMWTTETLHPAYQFYRLTLRGPTSDEACLDHEGVPADEPVMSGDFLDSFPGLTDGVRLAASAPSQWLMVSIRYDTRNWWGRTTTRWCLYQTDTRRSN